MRLNRPIGLLSLVLTAPISAQTGASPDPLAAAAEDVVVTARLGPPASLIDAIGYDRRDFLDPSRSVGRPAPPAEDPDWQPLDTTDRVRFGIADPRVPAYGLFDAACGHTLLLKIGRLPSPSFWRAVEERCTIVVIGGRERRHLADGFTTAFNGLGTQRHVGAQDRQPLIPG